MGKNKTLFAHTQKNKLVCAGKEKKIIADQIGVCPQSDQIPDHGHPMRQQADVGHAQDRATPVTVAVIPPYSLDAGNAFLSR